MNPPELPVTLAKLEAATRQVEAAIDALEAGAFDIAITLAGAAEGMLPPGQLDMRNSFLAKLLDDERMVRFQFQRKDWNAVLNKDRDWLKHTTPSFDDVLTIEMDDAAFMIARALSRVDPWTTRMQDFKIWFMKHIDGSAAKKRWRLPVKD